LVDDRPGAGRPLQALLLACALLAVLLLSLGSPRVWGAQPQSQAQITLSYRVIGGGTYQPPSLTYEVNGQNASAVLTVNATTYKADIGSTWSVPEFLGGGLSYLRWEITGNASGIVQGQTLVLTYYTQYYATFGIPPEVLDTSPYIPSVNYSLLGVTHNITAGLSTWADALAPYYYSVVPANQSDSRWYCPSPTGVIQGAFSIDPNYVEQYLTNFTLSTTGSEPLPSANFTYRFSGQATNQTLGASGVTLWVDSNTTFSFQSTIGSQAGTNRWVLHSVMPALVIAPSTVRATYFEQYPLSVAYSVLGGQAPSGPIVNESSNGVPTSIEPYPGAPSKWVDAGSGYSVSLLLTGTTPDERWITTNATTGVIGSPTALNFVYYHQALIGFSYSVAGGGKVQQSNVTFYSFGVKGSVSLATYQQSVWADSGTTLSFRGNFSGSTPKERWMLGSPPTVVVSGPGVLNLVYYHQFLVPAAYSIIGGGSPAAPRLSGTEFGVPFARPITSGSSFWLDGGSTWSVPGVLPGAQGERWVAAGHTTGNVTAAAFPTLTYDHEYYVTVTSDPAGAASLTPGGWVQAGQPIAISASPSDGWSFSGWLGTGEGSYSGSNQSFSTPVSAPLQETASFDVEFALRVTGSGSVLVSIGSNSYTVTGGLTLYVKPGTNISLAATPGTLRSFGGWHGVSGGSASPAVFTVTSPTFVSAGFGFNLVLVVGVVALVCGAAVYAVAYLAWKKRVSPGRLLGLR